MIKYFLLFWFEISRLFIHSVVYFHFFFWKMILNAMRIGGKEKKSCENCAMPKIENFILAMHWRKSVSVLIPKIKNIYWIRRLQYSSLKFLYHLIYGILINPEKRFLHWVNRCFENATNFFYNFSIQCTVYTHAGLVHFWNGVPVHIVFHTFAITV